PRVPSKTQNQGPTPPWKRLLPRAPQFSARPACSFNLLSLRNVRRGRPRWPTGPSPQPKRRTRTTSRAPDPPIPRKTGTPSAPAVGADAVAAVDVVAHALDRKSTRLNSSHVSISYDVF